MPTFNGWDIQLLPVYPTPASIDFTDVDTVGVTTSPFTGQQQTQDWQASWLEASVSMPSMKLPVARAWIAWLKATRGMNAVFLFGDPLAVSPSGSGAGAPIVSGAGQTGYTLATTGWTSANALLPGDWFSIGFRMYMNLGAVNSGSQTLRIWPQLREPPANGAPLVLTNPQGMFRLKSNQRKWSVSDARVYGVQFEIREAL